MIRAEGEIPQNIAREALRLVEDGLFLREYGERPPGAPRDPLGETWYSWDTRAQTLLRAAYDPENYDNPRNVQW